MKTKFLFLVVLIGAAFSCQKNIENASTRIVIDRYTTEKDLAAMIEGVKAANIILAVDRTTFNEHGRLVKIKGTVEFPDKGSASFNSEKVGKIIITKDLADKDGGFSVVVKNRWF